jgi:hypothetical protein
MIRRPCSKRSSCTHIVPNDVGTTRQIVDIFRHLKGGSSVEVLPDCPIHLLVAKTIGVAKWQITVLLTVAKLSDRSMVPVHYLSQRRTFVDLDCLESALFK